MRLWRRVYRGDVYFQIGGRCYYMGKPTRILDIPGDLHLIIAPEKVWLLAKIQYRLHQTWRVLFGAFISVCSVWGLTHYNRATYATWRDLPIISQLRRRAQ